MMCRSKNNPPSPFISKPHLQILATFYAILSYFFYGTARTKTIPQLYIQGLEQTLTFLWFLPLEAHAHHTNYTNDCFSGFWDGQMEYSMIGTVGGWILERKTNFFRFIIITPCPGGLHDKRMWLNSFAGGKNVIKDNTPLLSKYQAKKQSSRRKGESQDIHVLNNLQSIIESPRWRIITTTKIREYAKTRTSTSDKWKNSSLLSQNLSQSNYDK